MIFAGAGGHSALKARTGGSDGVRDTGLIESALMRANASYGGVEAYTSIPQKGAAVCCGLIGNHGFVDGNKRIAVMLLILRRNNVAMRYTQQELIHLGLSTAQGCMDVDSVAQWIQQHAPEV